MNERDALEAFMKLRDLLASIDFDHDGDFIDRYGLAKPLNQLEAALAAEPAATEPVCECRKIAYTGHRKSCPEFQQAEIGE